DRRPLGLCIRTNPGCFGSCLGQLLTVLLKQRLSFGAILLRLFEFVLDTLSAPVEHLLDRRKHVLPEYQEEGGDHARRPHDVVQRRDEQVDPLGHLPRGGQRDGFGGHQAPVNRKPATIPSRARASTSAMPMNMLTRSTPVTSG